jgi:hypothetical protein
MAVDAFSEDGTESVKGWIYGGVSAWLYAGNIYGSVVAAEQHNLALEMDILNKAGGLAVEMSLRL